MPVASGGAAAGRNEHLEAAAETSPLSFLVHPALMEVMEGKTIASFPV